MKKIKIDEEYILFASEDIPSNQLLFEISGEMLNYDELLKKNMGMKKENYCYFEIIKTTKTKNSLYMLISEYGNISYFLKKASPLSENVIIKAFYIPQNLKIIALK